MPVPGLMSEMLCSGCEVLLGYEINALSVRCPLCRTVTGVPRLFFNCPTCNTRVTTTILTTCCACSHCLTKITIPVRFLPHVGKPRDVDSFDEPKRVVYIESVVNAKEGRRNTFIATQLE